MKQTLLLLAIALPNLVGCSIPTRVGSVVTSDEKRIWVVRVTKDGDEVFRCADGAASDKPPRPVCVRAPMVDTPQ